MSYHILKSKEPYRHAEPTKASRKIGRLRFRVTGQRKALQRFRFDEEQIANRPQSDDITVRYIPPLSYVYESEGLPRAKSRKKRKMYVYKVDVFQEF